MILGLIGAGKWGQNYLLAVKSVWGATIKYVCSSPSSLQTLSSEYIKLEDYKKLSQLQDLDGVIIAVPAKKHFEIATFFLSSQVPILVEKPMVTSLDEAKKLQSILVNTKGKLMVGNIFLYNDAFQVFARRFRKIKNIQYLNFEDCNWGPIRDDVSALWDWGPHDVSMCLKLLEKPHSVSAKAVNVLRPTTNLYDMIYASFTFKNNVTAFFKMGWLSPVKKREILAVGKEESLLFNDLSDKKILYFDKSAQQTHITYPSSEPLVNEIKAFVDLIKENKTSKRDIYNDFLIIEVIDAIERSIKENGAIIYLTQNA